MRQKGFLIVRCPHCRGRYAYTPIQQTIRLCTSCRRIYRINLQHAQYIDDARQAIALVKFYQSGKHHEEFAAAVAQSNARTEATDISDNSISEHPKDILLSTHSVTSRHRILRKILRKYAGSEAVDLCFMAKRCEEAGISWNWAVLELENLISSGDLVCPKPWQIRLTTIDNPPTNTSDLYNSTVLARRISEIIQGSKSPINLENLIGVLKQHDIPAAQVREVLERLKIQGYVYQTKEGNLQWIGDTL